MSRFLSSLVAVVLVCGVAGPVLADSMTFDVGNPGVTGNGTVSSPYASVTVTGNTSTGIVDFQVSVGSNPAKLGSFGFNYNAGVGSFNLSSFSGVGGNTSSWGLQSGANMDGFGSFNSIVGPSTSGAANRLTSFDFQLQLSDHSQALASNFEVLNAGGGNGPGFAFSQEYFPNSGSTGFVGVNSLGTSAVPAPPSVVLLGIGFCGWLGARWRKRKLAAA